MSKQSKVSMKALMRVGLACAVLGAVQSLYANGQVKEILTPMGTVKFDKLLPNGTSTAGAAGLWDDPTTGRSSALVKFTRGSTTSHVHTFDYQLIVVKGTVIHKTDGIPTSGTTRLLPGSYWYQPAGVVHQDSCLEDECILFMTTSGEGETHNAPFTK